MCATDFPSSTLRATCLAGTIVSRSTMRNFWPLLLAFTPIVLSQNNDTVLGVGQRLKTPPSLEPTPIPTATEDSYDRKGGGGYPTCKETKTVTLDKYCPGPIVSTVKTTIKVTVTDKKTITDTKTTTCTETLSVTKVDLRHVSLNF